MNYLKTKYDEKNISIYHFIAIIPLVIYGLYKNIIYVYMNYETSLLNIIYPLVYLIFFALIILITKKITKTKLNMNDFYMYSSVLFLPFTDKYFIVIPLFLIFYILSLTKFKLPYNVIYILLLYLLLNIFNDLNFLNILEYNKDFNYSLLDKFLGLSNSYIFTSSYLCLVISYIYLSLKPYFKKNIFISFSIFYIIITFILYLLNIYEFTNLTGVLASILFIASSFKYTPNTFKKSIIYSLLLCILTILFNLIINYYIGVFIAILIMQIVPNFVTRKSFTK